MKWCAIMLQDSTPPAYFDALPSYGLGAQKQAKLFCFYCQVSSKSIV